VTRAELYDLVWSAPSAHVARQFGIPTAALRKLCSDYTVPLPSSGYWTKVAFGKQTPRKPLPDIAPKIVERFNDALRRFGRAALDAADVQIDAYNLNLPDIAVPAAEPMPLIDEIVRALSADTPAGEMVCADWPGRLNVQVAPASVPRTLSFISDLLAAAQTAGFSVSLENGMVIDGEIFSLRVYETRKKSRGGKTKPAVAMPSGRLCFEIVDPRLFRWADKNLVGRWYDAKSSRIEDKIRVALADAINATSLIRSARNAYESELKRRIDVVDHRRENAAR
jgi:hypothetical protein